MMRALAKTKPAPGAELMHAAVIPGGSGTFAQVVAGMQWAIAPFDAQGDPAGEPADVVSMSLGAAGHYDQFIEPTQNLYRAGIFPALDPTQPADTSVVQDVADTAAPVLQPVADVTSPVVDTASPVVDTASPILDTVNQTTEPVGDAAGPLLDAAQPVVDTVTRTTDPVIGPLVDSSWNTHAIICILASKSSA